MNKMIGTPEGTSAMVINNSDESMDALFNTLEEVLDEKTVSILNTEPPKFLVASFEKGVPMEGLSITFPNIAVCINTDVIGKAHNSQVCVCSFFDPNRSIFSKVEEDTSFINICNALHYTPTEQEAKTIVIMDVTPERLVDILVAAKNL